MPGYAQYFDAALNYNNKASYGNPTVPQPQPGMIWIDQDVNQVANGGGVAYRFVSVDSGSANVTNGTVLLALNAKRTIATTVVGTGARNLPAGIGVGNITAGNCGWLQIRGLHTAVNTGNVSVAIGDSVIASATAGQATNTAAGTASTYVPLGYATGNSSANVTGTYLSIPE